MSDTSGQLVRYDAMCRAIAEAYAVDEVKDIRDKARAIEMYARQAQNREAEHQAIEIRLRAERKCGELTGELFRAQGHRSDLTLLDRPTKSEALTDAGISREQAAQWERLAAIPADQFEADLSDRMWRPSTSGMIERHEARERGPAPSQAKMDPDALWLWGTLQRFEENGVLSRDPDELLSNMVAVEYEHMEQTTRRLAPIIVAWLGRIK